jgi:ABC-type ATPase involved in cell division
VLRLIAVFLRLDGQVVLDAVSAEARAGELVVIEGSRGAGKTTLMEVMAARRRPDGGQVWIAGHDVTTLQRDSLPFVRRNIGVAAVAPRFLPGLDVLENVMLPLYARAESMEWAREAALRALGKVGIAGLAMRDPATLSGSARRLAGIARALAGAPPLLLLDDPSASLVPADSGAVLSALLGSVESGAAAICVSSDGAFTAAAVRAGARRLHIEAGRLLPAAGSITLVPGGRATNRLTRRDVSS